MAYATLTPEDQEAFRHVLSREMTWGEFRFLQVLFAQLPAAEERDWEIFRELYWTTAFVTPLQMHNYLRLIGGTDVDGN
jgi:hypothetical protein